MTDISTNVAQPIINLQNVSVGYDGKDVLQDIYLSLLPGSFTFITGKSGSGKTTLLSMLYLIKKPSKGTLNVFGKNINFSNRDNLALMRQKIGVVFQDFRLLEHMTVYDNIALPLRVRGMNEKEIHKRVVELLKWIELHKSIYKVCKVSRFCHGERSSHSSLIGVFLIEGIRIAHLWNEDIVV